MVVPVDSSFVSQKLFPLSQSCSLDVLEKTSPIGLSLARGDQEEDSAAELRNALPCKKSSYYEKGDLIMSLENSNNLLDNVEQVNSESFTETKGSFNRFLKARYENLRINSTKKHQTLEEIMQELNAHDARVGPLQHGSSEESAGIESNEPVEDPQKPVVRLRGGGSESSKMAAAINKGRKLFERSPEDTNKELIKFYKTLKYNKKDKTDDFIKYNTEIHRRVSKTHTPELQITTQTNRAISTVSPEEWAISVSHIHLSKKDSVRASDMIALHYLFSMQQFYGIGKSDNKPIPLLKPNRSILLRKRHARALKECLSPLFSSSPSEVKDRMDQIPEQLHKMKKLTFKGVQNTETRKVMNPYCPLEKEKGSGQQGNGDPSSQKSVNPNQNIDSIEPLGASDPSGEIHYQVKETFLKGSRAYTDFLTRTPLGECVVRMQKKYFSDSNITMVEYERQNNPDALGNIIIHFDYEE